MVRSRSAALVRRRLPRGLLLLLVLALATTAGCSRSLDMAALNQSISSGINDQLALPVSSVTCPPARRALQTGDTFECLPAPQAGGKLTVTVTQKDGAGNVAWEVTKTEGLLDLDKVEAALADGRKAVVKVTTKGVEGNIDWSVE